MSTIRNKNLKYEEDWEDDYDQDDQIDEDEEGELI